MFQMKILFLSRIDVLKLNIMFPKQKVQNVYSRESICYQFNPKVETENERTIEKTFK